MTVVLRAGAAADGPRLADLWVEAWTAAMPGIDFDARRPWFDTHRMALDAAGASTVVAVDPDGAPLGFVTVDPAAGYIDQLAVAPAAQRQGVAARLLAEVRRISPERLALHVNQDNPGAVRFYETQGFAVSEASVNPRSGLPVWRMEWRPPRAAATALGDP